MEIKEYPYRRVPSKAGAASPTRAARFQVLINHLIRPFAPLKKDVFELAIEAADKEYQLRSVIMSKYETRYLRTIDKRCR